MGKNNLQKLKEFAVPPGSQLFLKHELGGQFNYSLDRLIWEGAAINFLFKGGAISWCGNRNGLSISDKYFLGGSNFYGFRERGVNNQIKEEENLGGDTFIFTSLHLALPFPQFLNIPKWIRPEAFLEFGNIINSQKQNYSCLFHYDNFRSSFGVGFALSTSLGRISFNISNPIHYKKLDKVSVNNIQFNFQLNWL